PACRPLARSHCANLLEASSSSRYVIASPLAAMRNAILSGLSRAWTDGCTRRLRCHWLGFSVPLRVQNLSMPFAVGAQRAEHKALVSDSLGTRENPVRAQR